MSQDTVLSLEDSLASLDHDWEMFQAMAELCVEQAPKDVAKLRTALGAEDAAALAATTEGEEMGKAGTVPGAGEACATLKTERPRLLAALGPMLHEGPSA